MTTEELLKKYGFKNLDEVKLIIKMSFPSIWRRAWVPVYPNADHVIKAIAFLRKYLQTNSIDVMVKYAKSNKTERN